MLIFASTWFDRRATMQRVVVDEYRFAFSQ
jgi:hypothetical protein